MTKEKAHEKSHHDKSHKEQEHKAEAPKGVAIKGILLPPGEKIKVVKGESPAHDKSETVPGFREGKKGKYGSK